MFAVTGHGLGHLTRTLAIVDALCALEPRVEPWLSTSVDRDVVAERLARPFQHRAAHYEPGVAQRDCFHVDTDGTRDAYRALARRRDALLDAERAFLRDCRARLVVCDVPALAVRAAADLELPAVAVANFTWDWILEPTLSDASGTDVVATLRDDYRAGTHHLVLPLGPAGSPFPSREPAPLVHRRARRSRGAVLAELGVAAGDGRRWVLVCPGGWDPDGWQRIRVAGDDGLGYWLVGDLPVECDAPAVHLPHSLPGGLSLPDLVAASDAVLAKPGYGIASECWAHDRPFLGVERPGFRETPVLMEALRREGPVAELSLGDFFAGAWAEPLRRLCDRGEHFSPAPADAARRVAERLCDWL